VLKGVFDMEINLITKFAFIFMLVASIIILVLRGFGSKWYIHFFRYILLLSWIIPISMRVNLDFAKAYFSYKINKDEEIAGSIARNSNIPEELGRIKYLLTDKTGTLTQNDMKFKKIVTENTLYAEENIPEMKKTLKKHCDKYDGPLATDQDLRDKSIKKNPSKKTRRENDFVLRDFITALALCHNVTPTIDEGQKIYQVILVFFIFLFLTTL
jgi:phospholipid-translocating ATPase